MADTSQVREITERLEQGVKDLFASDTYADYLKTMSRFHQYSTRNTLLIHMQNPKSTIVAGFNSWQSKFGRHVKKGEKAINILAPVPFTVREEKELLDPATRLPVLDDYGMPVFETKEKQLARFRVVHVFDVAQTVGKPLPSLAQDLTGDVVQYAAFIDALKTVSPLPIVFEPLPDNMDGLCRFGEKISIREGMSEVQTVCAAIHEITHAKLHDIEVAADGNTNAVPKDTRTEECEAESVSYAVCQFFGIETGANSFGYIAEWSRGRELKELNASLDTIRKTAAELIDSIDDAFREIAKERDIVFAIGEAQPTLDEPQPLPEQIADIPADRPTPGTVYARYSNQVSDIVGRDTAYANAFLNSDEQNARIECDMAVKRAVMGLFTESSKEHLELYRQFSENPDFKSRLEDYVFMRNYLEPKTAQRNAAPELNPTPTTKYTVGTTVLMTPLFDDMYFNRTGKKIRVTVEEPAGKHLLFSRTKHDEKKLYFLTASGRIDLTAEYFADEWNAQERKYENHLPTESELDEAIQEIAERFENDMANPTKWAKYQHAAVLNRLDECDAHNAPVRKLRDEEEKRRKADAEQERKDEQRQKQETLNARVDEISKAIEKGNIISVSYDKNMYDGKNPVLELFKLYDIALPLRTQGWVNTGLAELSESGYRYYSSKHKRNSTTFSEYLLKLREAIRLTPIEQMRDNKVNSDTTEKEDNNTVEQQLYEKFSTLFPRFMSGEFQALRLEAPHTKPLSLEWIFGDRISIAHTYELDGKPAYEPMVMLRIDSDNKTMTACSFELSEPPRNDVVYGENGRTDTAMQRNINNFTTQWLDRAEKQGFMPVEATIEIDGVETSVSFDEYGNPVIPKPQPGYREWSEPATAENAPEHPGIPSDDVNEYLSQTLTLTPDDKEFWSNGIAAFLASNDGRMELDDLELSPLNNHGGLGKFSQVFSEHGYKREFAHIVAEENAKRTGDAWIVFNYCEGGAYRPNFLQTPSAMLFSEADAFIKGYEPKIREMHDGGYDKLDFTLYYRRGDNEVCSSSDRYDIGDSKKVSGFYNVLKAETDFYYSHPEIFKWKTTDENFASDKELAYADIEILKNAVTTEYPYIEIEKVVRHADGDRLDERVFNEGEILTFAEADSKIKGEEKAMRDRYVKKYGNPGDGDEELGIAVHFKLPGDSEPSVYRVSYLLGDYDEERSGLLKHFEMGATYYNACIGGGDYNNVNVMLGGKTTDDAIRLASEYTKIYETLRDCMDEPKEKAKNVFLDMSLPDPTMTASDMNEYGYVWDNMLPLSNLRAVELFDTGHTVFLLYPDNTEAMAFDRDEIRYFDGLCGIERADWERSPVFAAQMAVSATAEGRLESDLLYGIGDCFGIYQVKGGEEMRDYLFEAHARLHERGLSVNRGNYELVYTMQISDLFSPLTDKKDFLHQVYETFNVSHPKDYTGRSVSVSDVIVLKYNGEISSHYVDSGGFTELPAFLGEETQKLHVAETPEQTYSQVGTTPKNERVAASKPERASVPKPKLTLIERLDANKRKAAQQGQPDAANHNKNREV